MSAVPKLRPWVRVVHEDFDYTEAVRIDGERKPGLRQATPDEVRHYGRRMRP